MEDQFKLPLKPEQSPRPDQGSRGASSYRPDQPLDNDPNYDVLVDKLHNKTIERKIIWELGDEPDEYVASLRGKTTFTIRRIKENYRYVLTMRNETDEIVFRISHDNLEARSSEALLRLYKLAERIAKQIDDEVDKAIHMLDDLDDDE